MALLELQTFRQKCHVNVAIDFYTVVSKNQLLAYVQISTIRAHGVQNNATLSYNIIFGRLNPKMRGDVDGD